MSAVSGNLRTVWISIRALNYTQRVFDDIMKSMTSTIASEKQMIQQTQAMTDSAVHFIAAGALMLTLSVMLGMQIYNLAASSQEGAVQMGQLKQKFDETMASLANAAFHVLEMTGVLTLLNNICDWINKNPFWAQVIMFLGMMAIGFIAVAGTIFVLVGLFQMLTAWFSPLIAAFLGLIGVETTSAVVTHALGMAFTYLVAALGPIMIGVMLFFELKDVLGTIPALIVAITVAVIALAIALWVAAAGMNVLSFGAASAAGGGLKMASFGGAASSGAFLMTGQMGTRALPYTGLFMGHKGEVVYNPATNRPAQIGGELAGGQGETNTFNMPIVIENIHTKADFDDVNEKLRVALRDKMRGRK